MVIDVCCVVTAYTCPAGATFNYMTTACPNSCDVRDNEDKCPIRECVINSQTLALQSKHAQKQNNDNAPSPLPACKNSHKKMAAKGGSLYFKILGPPPKFLDPLAK